MLTELCIRNFALIDKLQIRFDKGLNILTGETGAGKSIVITAVSLLLGGRASLHYIRSGKECAEVEGSFQIDNHPIIFNYLLSSGFPLHEKEDIIIKRIIYRQEKSNRCYINGRLCPLGTLIFIGAWLIDMHGQHEHQRLLTPANHQNILDKFASLEEEVQIVSNLFNTYKETQANLAALQNKENQIITEQQLLNFQKEEIDKANLVSGELDSLYERRSILVNSKKIKESTNKIQEALYQSDGAVSEILSKIQSSLLDLSKIDKFFNPLANQLGDTICQIEDISGQLLEYGEKFELNIEDLDEFEDRIDEIKKLQKKYQADSVEELLELSLKIEQKLDNYNSLKENILKTQNSLNSLKLNLDAECSKLTQKRKSAAIELESKLNKEFKSLSMNEAKFSVSFKKNKENISFGPNGWDQIEYLISTNFGEPLKPLAQIASGGEISRIMLALKSSLSKADQVLSLIFDEIDTGIGGKIIGLIAKKLKQLANKHQIICITHSPQIASCADTHYVVNKEIVGMRTLIQVKELNKEERIDEIAKMMGADSDSVFGFEHAKEILQKST